MVAFRPMSEAPKDKMFMVQLTDSFGPYVHGPCRINKNGVLVFCGHSGTENVHLRNGITVDGWCNIGEVADSVASRPEISE